jgi:hypothetical protein
MNPMESLMEVGEVEEETAPMNEEVSFPVPKGFSPPQNYRPGEAFEAIAKLRMSEDGMLKLEALDGVKLEGEGMEEEGYEEEAEVEEQPVEQAGKSLGQLIGIA